MTFLSFTKKDQSKLSGNVTLSDLKKNISDLSVYDKSLIYKRLLYDNYFAFFFGSFLILYGLWLKIKVRKSNNNVTVQLLLGMGLVLSALYMIFDWSENNAYMSAIVNKESFFNNLMIIERFKFSTCIAAFVVFVLVDILYLKNWRMVLLGILSALSINAVLLLIIYIMNLFFYN